MNQIEIPIISTEQAHLWKFYISDTMMRCVMRHFVNSAKDKEVKAFIQQMLAANESAILWSQNLFHREKMAVPDGFSDQDVNPNAPQLYNDPFILDFLGFMCRIAVDASSRAIAVIPRKDIRSFFIKRLHEFAQFEDQLFDMLLEKGLFVNAPYVPLMEKVRYVQEPSFFGGLIGEQRPLQVLEINHFFINSLQNNLGKQLLVGLSQTTANKEIRDYMERGIEMSSRFTETFQSLLRENDLPGSELNSVGVTDSTEPPFSDKLILNLVVSLNAYAIALYGISLSECARNDLTVTLARISAETANYAADGAKLLVKLGYMEEPPQAPNRKELTNVQS